MISEKFFWRVAALAAGITAGLLIAWAVSA